MFKHTFKHYQKFFDLIANLRRNDRAWVQVPKRDRSVLAIFQASNMLKVALIASNPENSKTISKINICTLFR